MIYYEETGLYEPGIIYELRYFENGIWTPFYVGETTDRKERLKEHQSKTKNATEDSYSVYLFTSQIEQAGIKWDMFDVNTYGTDGPRALEDEHIMFLLVKNVKLTNEKRGSKRWMENKLKEAADMQSRGITSYKLYQQTLADETLAEKHNRWLKEHHINRIYLLEEELYSGKHYTYKKDMKKMSLDLLRVKRKDLIETKRKRRLGNSHERNRQKIMASLNASAIETKQHLAEQHRKRAEAKKKAEKDLSETRKLQEAEWLATGRLIGEKK